MRESNRVQSSQVGKLTLKQAYKAAGFTQVKLAKKVNISLDTLKKLLGTRPSPKGIERWVVQTIAQVLNIQPTDIVDPNHWYLQQQLPPKFEHILDYLPERIRQAIEDYSKETQLAPELVIERAIAHFLDVDSVTFNDCKIDSSGSLRE